MKEHLTFHHTACTLIWWQKKSSNLANPKIRIFTCINDQHLGNNGHLVLIGGFDMLEMIKSPT